MSLVALTTEGFGLGLSLGVSCLATCAPVYLPFLMAEKRKTGSALLTTLEISAGRFFSYLVFGAVVGMLGGRIETLNRELFTSIADLLIAVFLVFTALRTNRQHRSCPVPKLAKFSNNAFLLGIVTGINFCPGFLGALSRAMAAGGAVGGMALFFGFFLGTTLFVLPMGFAGALTHVKKLVVVGQIASLFAAAWFVFTGVRGLYHVYEATRPVKGGRFIETVGPSARPLILTADTLRFRELADSLTHSTGHPVRIRSDLAGVVPTDSLVLFVDTRLETKLQDQLKTYDCILVEPTYPVAQVMGFLRLHGFQTDKPLHWEFRQGR
jgi:sulfite exporter TauE/SafE